jgi:hypothetical protein
MPSRAHLEDQAYKLLEMPSRAHLEEQAYKLLDNGAYKYVPEAKLNRPVSWKLGAQYKCLHKHLQSTRLTRNELETITSIAPGKFPYIH